MEAPLVGSLRVHCLGDLFEVFGVAARPVPVAEVVDGQVIVEVTERFVVDVAVTDSDSALVLEAAVAVV